VTALPPHAGQRVEYAGAPLDRARLAMIAVHGRGAGPEAILELVPRIDRPNIAYVAPAASGQTWYPYSFLSPREKNEPGISSALSVLESLVQDLMKHGFASDRIALLGFSQGACLTCEFVFRHPRRYAAVFGLSGGLIGPPGTSWENPPGSPSPEMEYSDRRSEAPKGGALKGTPIFLGCSDTDAHIPAPRVLETEVVFAGMGASVKRELYPGMGHLVNEEEILVIQSILKQITG